MISEVLKRSSWFRTRVMPLITKAYLKFLRKGLEAIVALQRLIPQLMAKNVNSVPQLQCSPISNLDNDSDLVKSVTLPSPWLRGKREKDGQYRAADATQKTGCLSAPRHCPNRSSPSYFTAVKKQPMPIRQYAYSPVPIPVSLSPPQSGISSRRGRRYTTHKCLCSLG
jgi:hypothetical protein